MNFPAGNPPIGQGANSRGIPTLDPHAQTVANPLRKTLRRLVLTLFLRRRSSRGLQKGKAPKSVATKLSTTLLVYALLGLMALFFRGQPIFTLSIYLHGMTLVFLGMFVASSAGEVLFNKEEGDILLHRPVTPRALLQAKVGVLLHVCLWLAGAFNLAGSFVWAAGPAGGWACRAADTFSARLSPFCC